MIAAVRQHPDVRTDAISDGPIGEVLRRIRSALEVRLGSASSLRRIERRIERVASLTVRELTEELTIEVPQIARPGVLAERWLVRNQALGRGLASSYVEGVRRVLERAEPGVRGESLVRDIVAQTGLARYEARRIAVNETLTLHAEINEERQRALGVRQYVWSTAAPAARAGSSQDRRVRPWHEALNQTVQSWDAPPLGGGTRADDRGHPGSGIYCRCVAVAVIDDTPAPSRRRELRRRR